MSAADLASALVRGVCWLVLAGGVVLIPLGLRALVGVAFTGGADHE